MLHFHVDELRPVFGVVLCASFKEDLKLALFVCLSVALATVHWDHCHFFVRCCSTWSFVLCCTICRTIHRNLMAYVSNHNILGLSHISLWHCAVEPEQVESWGLPKMIKQSNISLCMPQSAKHACECCVVYEFMLVPPNRSVECGYDIGPMAHWATWCYLTLLVIPGSSNNSMMRSWTVLKLWLFWREPLTGSLLLVSSWRCSCHLCCIVQLSTSMSSSSSLSLLSCWAFQAMPVWAVLFPFWKKFLFQFQFHFFQ